MSRKKYYMTIGKFSNLCTLFFVHDGADVNALKELINRGTSVEHITRNRALLLARKTHGKIYKCTSLFANDREKRFGKEIIYMDERGNMLEC